MSGNGAHYTCGSKQFIERIAVELFKIGVAREKIRMSYGERVLPLIEKYGEGPYPYRVHERQTQKGSFDIHISARTNLARLFEFFYADITPSIFMTRKRDKLSEFLKS